MVKWCCLVMKWGFCCGVGKYEISTISKGRSQLHKNMRLNPLITHTWILIDCSFSAVDHIPPQNNYCRHVQYKSSNYDCNKFGLEGKSNFHKILDQRGEDYIPPWDKCHPVGYKSRNFYCSKLDLEDKEYFHKIITCQCMTIATTRWGTKFATRIATKLALRTRDTSTCLLSSNEGWITYYIV